MKERKRIYIWAFASIIVLLAITLTGGSLYLMDYALAPNPERTDTAAAIRRQMKNHPEINEWWDSLRHAHAVRDTFMTMPTGERHHALYINKGVQKTALVIHGWRGCSYDFLFLAYVYERCLGYNVVLPDLHAHGLSEGKAINMGWKDRDDMMQWLQVYATDTMVVHGVSMGAATAMMLSAVKMPEKVTEVHIIEDCGYTSVWNEFVWQLKEEFGLPAFPLLTVASALTKLRYGWSFGQASALQQVRYSSYPIFFIHGDSDSFVPTEMVYRLYDAKPDKKRLWITSNTEHALSYNNHKEEYVRRIRDFIETPADKM